MGSCEGLSNGLSIFDPSRQGFARSEYPASGHPQLSRLHIHPMPTKEVRRPFAEVAKLLEKKKPQPSGQYSQRRATTGP